MFKFMKIYKELKFEKAWFTHIFGVGFTTWCNNSNSQCTDNDDDDYKDHQTHSQPHPQSQVRGSLQQDVCHHSCHEMTLYLPHPLSLCSEQTTRVIQTCWSVEWRQLDERRDEYILSAEPYSIWSYYYFPTSPPAHPGWSLSRSLQQHFPSSYWKLNAQGIPNTLKLLQLHLVTCSTWPLSPASLPPTLGPFRKKSSSSLGSYKVLNVLPRYPRY